MIKIDNGFLYLRFWNLPIISDCSRKNTNDEINIARIPVLEPERNIAIAITAKLITMKYHSIFFALGNKYNPIGNPIAKTAANQAGLSKLPVIANSE
ncbi:hypothetical protein [uncultured Sunxiuqinia sp.]|uniref:hypothetical protein n=1 Tax=uncultured Sunxiuqinia sp. TaxID=1573825 RepID=UPI002AA63B54|nr:hypothetical protein [uncultured Sunxiuqinia sp.]